MNKKKFHVLFVCMGNICRSPAGEGILKQLIKDHPSLHLHIESCGIGDWHLGQSPDFRMQQAAAIRGICLNGKAQQFQHHFFDRFDFILVADKEVLSVLYHHASNLEQKSKLHLMTEFGSEYKGQEVPDPYYKSDGAFDLVLDILEDSCQGFIQHLYQQNNEMNFS